MSYRLSEVSPGDVDMLVRRCNIPAMQQNPLTKIMFPKANSDSGEEQEAKIRWTIESLRRDLENESCYFRKVTIDGRCVVFALWSLEFGSEGMKQKAAVSSEKKRESWVPASLDVKP